MSAESCFRFLDDAASRGERGVLVTITGIVGSASRALGTHFAVAESGDWHGSLSGGCIEAAVAAEALRVLAKGRAEIVRFGAGSPYIDIRLPCGGGLDLLFMPDPPSALMAAALDRIRRRAPFTLRFGVDARPAVDEVAAITGWAGDVFSVRHHPGLRVAMAGQGEEIVAALSIARAYGAETLLWTPDATLAQAGDGGRLLRTLDESVDLAADAYTAVLLLFHEHDWETGLLVAALSTPAFYIGAMGSPATHAARLESLRGRGVAAADLARISGPIGLIPATRDPATLALSALAEIVAHYRELIERAP